MLHKGVFRQLNSRVWRYPALDMTFDVFRLLKRRRNIVKVSLSRNANLVRGGAFLARRNITKPSHLIAWAPAG